MQEYSDVRNPHLEKRSNNLFVCGNYKEYKYDIKSLNKSLRLRFCTLRFLKVQSE